MHQEGGRMNTETKSKLGITPTRGPWSVHRNIGRRGELGVVADSAPCIIAVMGNQRQWPAEAEANARLIAAAPVLLHACELAYSELCKMGCECDCENLPTSCPVCACKAALTEAA